MSRSRKKSPYIKVSAGHLRKQLAARKARRVNKVQVSLDKDPYLQNELVQAYDVCDAIFIIVDPKDLRK